MTDRTLSLFCGINVSSSAIRTTHILGSLEQVKSNNHYLSASYRTDIVLKTNQIKVSNMAQQLSFDTMKRPLAPAWTAEARLLLLSFLGQNHGSEIQVHPSLIFHETAKQRDYWAKKSSLHHSIRMLYTDTTENWLNTPKRPGATHRVAVFCSWRARPSPGQRCSKSR